MIEWKWKMTAGINFEISIYPTYIHSFSIRHPRNYSPTPLHDIQQRRENRERNGERERIDREKSGARSGRGEMMIQRTTNPIAGSGPIPDGRRVSRFQTTTTTAASLPLSPVFSSKKAARARKESGNIPRLFLRPGWRDLKTIAVVGRELHRLKMAWKKDRERERERRLGVGRGL